MAVDLVALDGVKPHRVVGVLKRIAETLGIKVNGDATDRSVRWIVKEGGVGSQMQFVEAVGTSKGENLHEFEEIRGPRHRHWPGFERKQQDPDMENTDVDVVSQQVEFLQQMMGDPEHPQLQSPRETNPSRGAGVEGIDRERWVGRWGMENRGNCPIYSDPRGKCRRNTDGRVVLPSGAFVPRTIQGKDLRARIEEWHRQNPGQLAAAQLLVEVAMDHLTSNSPYSSNSTQRTFTLSAEDRIQMLEMEINAIRTRG
ncbi:hypothetical protein B0H13DRAFT_1850381 [Mycena leptocephala]|nr:hypothetical protein B0H13DRAFT_1850381 [Mycena leptocephala]